MGLEWGLILGEAAAFFLAACGNRELSRDTAAQILKATLGLPEFTTTTIRKCFLKDAKGSQGYLCFDDDDVLGQRSLNSSMSTLEPLRKNGLLVFGKDAIKQAGYCRYVYATIELTVKGRTFLAGETADSFVVNESRRDFGEITGIQMSGQNTQARVEYTLVLSPTPFAPRASTA